MRAIWTLLVLFACTFTCLAENPHDGYAFWLPNGVYDPAKPDTGKAFKAGVAGGVTTLHVALRKTRFDTPRGQLVVIGYTPKSNSSLAKFPLVAVEDQKIGSLEPIRFVPQVLTNGKTEVKVSYTGKLPDGSMLRFYWTDDSAQLGVDLTIDSTYVLALRSFWSGDLDSARKAFGQVAAGSAKPEGARLARRMVRWCNALAVPSTLKSGGEFYDLGLYSMVNGFWELAESAFDKATKLMPKNPDAWYMLADAKSYVHSDLDTCMAEVAPLYRKAADLYPSKDANTFRTFFGLFRQLRVGDGKGGTTVIKMTDEQIAHVKLNWTWCSAIMEAASKGHLRMVNTYKVYDQEFDSTNDWNSKPYEGLFKAGTVDTFIKMTGWGASDCCGMDCGPDRSAFINLGIREWDVMLHEWNHSLDWAMVSSELGIGVPETHSSDWCGYQPISSMGMGHHSCNRYYMTPGMYDYVRGSDPITTPYVDNWLATAKPVELAPALTAKEIADSKILDPWVTKLRGVVAKVDRPTEGFVLKPKVEDGYINLLGTWDGAPKNGYGFARTYIYSPAAQKVRMWLSGDDNIRLWLNDERVVDGVYWACALFTEKKEKDMVSGMLNLQKGWNCVVVQVSNVQRAPDWLGGNPPDCWGFSLRLCDKLNREVPGLKWQAETPAGFVAPVAFPSNASSPKTFKWEAVKDDYTTLLPRLSLDQLRAITGYKTLNVTNDMLFDVSGEVSNAQPSTALLAKADPNRVALDNQLNWFFSPKENMAFLRYLRGGKKRDLVFLRPEGYDPFLTLGKAKAGDKVIGYFLVDRSDSANGRIVLVVDTYLGDKIPVDEEDLLSPFRVK